ncbi:MAG TPA: efflux RND transporter periplasmic adaptor subunit [Roseiflexaceae bacterium]|nr:efflux RND transporter periplasmic adaptor subunit [Roseiflexaceae bacterium]
MRRTSHSILVIGILSLALASCAGQATTTNTATATITRGELIQSVSGSGQVKPAQDANLNFGTTGIVAQVLVKEGQRVQQGDRLATIDTRELDQQVLQAEANLKSAQAAITALKNGPEETDLRAAQAQLEAAQIQLKQTRQGNARAADIASARAQLRAAQADLAALKTPGPDEISAAQLRLAQAQANLQNTRDGDSAAKTRAKLDLSRSATTLTQAQSRYATASQSWQYVQETGRDPVNPSKTNAQGKSVPNTLNDAQRQQYYDTFVQAEAALHAAEDAVTQAQVAYDSARQKEAADVPLAEQQVADAQRQLDALQNPTPQKLAAAEAKLAQAQAQLNQLSGGTPNDIALSEANVAQRQAALDALMAPPAEKDLAQAQANVAQAEANLARAKINRQLSELVAPFNGTIATVGIKPGDTVGGTGSQTAAIAMVDDSAFHVDVNISEADLAHLRIGQEASVELDALPGQQLAGSLDYIAPTATTQQNVTTYLARVSLKPTEQPLRAGLSAAVSIITDKRSDVLLAPNGAIQEADGGPQVEVKSGSTTQAVKISTGLVGDSFTEVTSGLKEGDVVMLAPPRARSGGFGP